MYAIAYCEIVVKQCFIFFSGPFHRERRRYLRVALNELYQLLSDSPGLLGPKVVLVWCTHVCDWFHDKYCRLWWCWLLSLWPGMKSFGCSSTTACLLQRANTDPAQRTTMILLYQSSSTWLWSLKVCKYSKECREVGLCTYIMWLSWMVVEYYIYFVHVNVWSLLLKLMLLSFMG